LQNIGVFATIAVTPMVVSRMARAKALRGFQYGAARRELLELCTGRQLSGGVSLAWRILPGAARILCSAARPAESERRQFSDVRCSFVNQLDGADRALKIAQRAHGRFINSSMMVTLLGAAVSDGLADGRVVSGVGGSTTSSRWLMLAGSAFRF